MNKDTGLFALLCFFIGFMIFFCSIMIILIVAFLFNNNLTEDILTDIIIISFILGCIGGISGACMGIVDDQRVNLNKKKGD